MKTIQQGDILLIPIETIPDGTPSSRDEHGRHVFARGATGHIHALDRDDPGAVYEQGSMTVLVVPAGGTTLRHLVEATGLPTQDHAAVPVPVGTWEVRRQREVRWGESSVVED